MGAITVIFSAAILLVVIAGPIIWAAVSSIENTEKQRNEAKRVKEHLEFQAHQRLVSKEIDSINDLHSAKLRELYKLLKAHKLPNVVDGEFVQSSTVICANEHRYRYSDLYYAVGTQNITEQNTTLQRENVMSTTDDTTKIYNNRPKSITDRILPIATLQGQHTTTHEVVIPVTETTTTSKIIYKHGCPLCHTTLFRFENPTFDPIITEFISHECPAMTSYSPVPGGVGQYILTPIIFVKRDKDCPFCLLEKQFNQKRAEIRTSY